MCRSLAVLVLVVIFASPVHGETNKGAPDFASAVRSCAAWVKDETNREAGAKPSKFDAHVDSDGIVGFIGTDAERSRFKKCLTKAGHPIDPLNR
jgi:hypothetical protein